MVGLFMRLALGILAAVGLLIVGVGSRVFRIKTIGSPTGNSTRVGETILTLMSRLEPYVPSLHRDPGKDRYTIGLLIHSARDTTIREFVPIVTGQRATSLPLVKFTAVTGNVAWFRAPEVGAYDVARRRLLAEEPGWASLTEPPIRRMSLADYATGDRAVLSMIISGAYPVPGRWIGVLSEEEAAGSFRDGTWLSSGYPLERSREPRRFYTTAVFQGEDGRPRIRKLVPLGGEGLLNAGFMRTKREGEALRLEGDGFLLLWESKPHRAGTMMAARVDGTGKVLWTVDTGIGDVRELLPDPASPALIGERPRIPDKVPEPILVVLDAASGRLVTHSLWLR
jgi:hypothetical protein